MRNKFIVLVAAMGLVALQGCANREAVAARQNPYPFPHQVVQADPSSEFYRQMALGPITGASQLSWFFPEPNRSILRPRFQRALESADLAAPTADLARYVIHLNFSQVEGPVAGSHMEAALIGRVQIVDRSAGAVILNEPIAARREAYWPGVSEYDWADGRFLDTLLILPFFFDSPWLSVGPRKDTVYPAYSGPEWFPLIPITYRETDQRLMIGPNGQAFGRWSGADRAWQVNAIVSDALAAAVFRRMAEDNLVEITRVLPCTGGADLRRFKRSLLARGERYTTPVCDHYGDEFPIGAEGLARRPAHRSSN